MGELVWTLHPNGGRVAGVAAPYDDWIRAIDRGWIIIRGQRAVVTDEAYLDRPGWVRFRILFDEPYPWPHP